MSFKTLDGMIAEDHLVVWNEEPGVVAMRAESEDVAPTMLAPNCSTFGKAVYMSLKIRKNRKCWLQNVSSGTRNSDDQQAWMEIWEMYGEGPRVDSRAREE